MINVILFLLVLGLIMCLLWLNYKLDKEMRRNRILQAFIAGIIRVICDYKSNTDQIYEEDLPDRTSHFPIPYHEVLENIDWELSKDQLGVNYEKWLKQDRNIFYDGKRYGNDGFNCMYLDLFDKKLNIWKSNDFISARKRSGFLMKS